MSAGLVLSQFENLVARTESMASKLSAKKIRPTKAQLDQFGGLKTRLTVAMKNIEAETTSLLQPHAEIADLANQIRSTKSNSQLTSSTMLSRNLMLIFIGPKISSLDSEQVKGNKEHTRSRCHILKNQHPHVILMWAAALPPSNWKTRAMTDITFDLLIHELKADRLNCLLPETRHSLESLEKEEPLNTCVPFKNFVSEVIELEAANEFGEVPGAFRTRQKRTLAEATHSEASSNKKACTETHFQVTDETITQYSHDILPIQQSRQIDYRCSDAPIDKLPILGPRLFRAVQNSGQWLWEQTVGGTNTTDCLNALVPKNRGQDISITILVGHEDGLKLIQDLEAIRV